jgi:nitronate monooxygenase
VENGGFGIAGDVMSIRPDRRALDLLGIELPVVQAPMAGPATPDMVAAVSGAGGLGSLPATFLSPDQIRTVLGALRRQTSKPVNLNYFCHRPPQADPARQAAWQQRLAPYYAELGLEPPPAGEAWGPTPFDEVRCEVVEALRPEIVSFHFGLPDPALVDRVKRAGAKILSSATTVAEAVWLQDHGCDAVIAQGLEAGGHRGTFLSADVSGQAGTMALVPQIVDAVTIPVIAAGGIADPRGVAAALALGASAVQVGTAYLFCPEATLSPLHRQALASARDDSTVITNVFTGRPARAIVNRVIRDLGPIAGGMPDFPLPGGPLAPLRAASEPSGADDFVPLWAGQAAHLGREMPAANLTLWLAGAPAVRPVAV